MKEGIKERREEGCKEPDGSTCMADACVGSAVSSGY
jgi:hypothetical protein